MGELTLQGAAQIVDFFLINEQVAVAGDAERVAAARRDAGEQLAGEAHQRMPYDVDEGAEHNEKDKEEQTKENSAALGSTAAGAQFRHCS